MRHRAANIRYQSGSHGFDGDESGAQHARLAGREINDGRFDANLAGTAVEHEVNRLAEFIAHMLRGGGADVTKFIG